MFTVAQCLAKVLELEQRADERLPPEVRNDYRDMARDWRHLADRAVIQDRRTGGTT